MKLYIYEHCPFCVRPRIIIGLKSLDIPLIYLANDDEQAHLDRIGKKQVPFLEKDNGSYLIESLAICEFLNSFDQHHVLSPKNDNSNLITLMEQLNKAAKTLIYPRCIEHPQNQVDFPTENAKNYFRRKKEAYVGCFAACFRFPEAGIGETQPILEKINQNMTYKYATADQPSWDDIMIFPMLRMLTLAEDVITIPTNIKGYLELLSERTNIALYKKYDYHQNLSLKPL